jgi:aromatic-L-amino-acid/L-tryptophan decarboxylase
LPTAKRWFVSPQESDSLDESFLLDCHRMIMSFAFDSATRRKLGYQLIDRVDEFYSSLPERPVQLPAEQRTYGPLSNVLPERGADPGQVLDEVCREMVDKGFHVPAANYFGLMNPTPAYMAFLGEALVAALNPQLATLARSQLASKIEVETVRWIGERVGWPGETFNGTFTSGGNEANFSGLALAIASRFPEAIEEGIVSIGRQPVLYTSAEAHHSLDKSAGLLGIGRRALRRVPVNESLQLDLDQLEQAIRKDLAAGKKPFCVVATAGTTNSGAVDDILALYDICQRHALWLHVDGAYGGAAVFSDRHRDLVRGIELADSITIDPHKWLAMPYAAGVILTRHPEALEQAFSIAAAYMPKAAGATLPDNSRISTQWTRRMNALKLWLALRVHGRQAYEQLIDRQLTLAHKFADWVQSSGDFELAAKPLLPIVIFRLKDRAVLRPPASAEGRLTSNESQLTSAHAAIVEEVTRDGRRWISDTVVNGSSVLRMMVISYLSDERHLENLQSALARAAKTALVSP